jgi:hypothetical protein
MPVHELAGKPVPSHMLVNIPRLISAYYTDHPDPADPEQQVAFGTSGHRGSSFKRSFNEVHILAISQAICEHRSAQGISGPLFMGMDTHALSEPAFITALEVLGGNGIEVRIQQGRGYTPTPVVSHAILTYNRGRTSGMADGIVITPSHNPPQDGGFKYNPPEGGPAESAVTRWIENRANAIISGGGRVRRVSVSRAISSGVVREHDFVRPYVDDLGTILDMETIAGARLSIGVDPLGGAGIGFWDPIAERYGLNIEVVNRVGGPDLLLHARGPGREGAHGLFLPLRHVQPDRTQGPFRHRIWKRPGQRPARHRHKKRRARPAEPLSGRGRVVPLPEQDRAGVTMPQSARPWFRARSSTGLPLTSGEGSARCQLGSSGSWKASWTAPTASVGRRAPGPRFSARMGRSGPRTRTGSSWTCSRLRSRQGWARTRHSSTVELTEPVRCARIRAHRGAGDIRAEEAFGGAFP